MKREFHDNNKVEKMNYNLERQIQNIVRFAVTQSPKGLEIISEVGSELNDTCKRLVKLILLV